MRGPAFAALGLVVVAGLPARAEDRWPEAAERRYAEATALSQKGEFAKAAAAYREVAFWPTGGDFRERAQALYCAGLQLDSAKEYDRALATFHEVVARWPGSSAAQNATGEIAKLDPPGARGIEFRRRLNEAWDVLLPAERTQPPGPELGKAIQLLEALLKDHRDHPQACDVALAIGDARARLGDLDGARAALEDGVALAKREADKPGADAVAAGNLANAGNKLAEGRRAIRRRSLDRMAGTLLVLALGVLVSVRPWRSSPRRLFRLAAKLFLADALLAVAAVGLAEYVRRYVDDHSPLEDGAAALLVLLPGLTGIVVSLGIANAVRTRRGTILAGVSGAVAGAAVAVMLIYACGLFPFLDQEL